MNTIFKSFSFAALSFLVLSYSSALAQSTQQLPLFIASSNAFSETLEVNLTADVNSDATGFLYSLQGSDTAVPLTDLPKGISLYQLNGQDVATLSSKTFSAINGGALTLTYLHNGVQGTYQQFNFALSRQGQAWNSYVIDANGIPRNFTTMYLTAKKLFGKIIGIERISVK